MKKTILYFYPNPATFIKKDIDAIGKYYNLKTHEFLPGGGISMVGRFLSQLVFIIKNIGSADGIVCFFVGYHSLLPILIGRLFGKPCISFIAGTESHSYPSINYGSLRKPIYAWFTKTSLLNSTHISPVHKSLVFFEDTYYGKDYPNQGYEYFIPGIKVPYTEIYFGYDDKAFYPLPGVSRIPNSFITVATNFDGGEFYRKGADLIIEAAKAFPDYTFTIIGRTNNKFPSLPNLKLIPPVPNERLKEYLSAHEFYFQLSIAEGFPNAPCEAMLCGCIPIGSTTYAIPLIIGNTGFLLPKWDAEQLKDLIKKAVVSDKAALSKAARERIITEFPMERREKEIINLLNKLIR